MTGRGFSLGRFSTKSDLTGVIPTQFDRRFLVKDLQAGIILSFMAIAFGLAIANISNFPLMAGIISAVVGGLIGSFFGRSITSIYGSAAALAPILAMSVALLGKGDTQAGYEGTLVVIFMTGIVMFALGQLRWTRIIASFFSESVIGGVLASIAVMLLLSRLPMFFGTKFHENGFERIFEVPEALSQATGAVLAISLITLAFLVTLSILKRWVPILRAYPPQLFAIPLVLALSLLFGLPQEHRVFLPENVFEGLSSPNFGMIFGDWNMFWGAMAMVLILATVDTAETVATVLGIGRLDMSKYKGMPGAESRTPDVDKTVRAMGAANLVSSFLGGMSNIPGGAKSTMNTQIGAKTAWTGVICALMVVIWVFLGKGVINLLPNAGLAMIIVFSVMKLAGFHVWQKFWKIGPDQFLVFATTFAFGVYHNDILFGMAVGIGLQIFIALVIFLSASRTGRSEPLGLLMVIRELWTHPNVRIETAADGVYDLHFEGTWLFFKSLDRVFEKIPHGTKARFHIGEKVYLIDAPTMERIHEYAEKHNFEVHICAALQPMPMSSDKHATRYRRAASSAAA